MKKSRIVFYIMSFLLGGIVATYACPLISGNPDALNIISTIFSVLAGFLLAILTFISDPAILQGKSKQYLSVHKVEVSRVILRHSILFYMYLLTLALVFTISLMSSIKDESFKETLVYIEQTMLFFATSSFVLSLGLPQVLVDIQSRRLEQIMN